MNANIYPVGTPGIKCHHMPEKYYEKWDRLYADYKRELRKDPGGKNTLRCSKLLVAHENAFCTD